MGKRCSFSYSHDNVAWNLIVAVQVKELQLPTTFQYESGKFT